MFAPGSSFSTIGRMVAAPSTSVSSRPRRLSMRSVKTWPRSRSAPSWISSIATNATSRSRGIASTVETQKRGFGGLIFSSPVTSATVLRADALDALVVDLAREQPQRQADDAASNAPSMRSMARWVLPVLVGPSTAVTPAPRARASRVTGEEKEMGIDDRKPGQ